MATTSKPSDNTPEAKRKQTLEICKQLKGDFVERDKQMEEVEKVIYMKAEPRVPRGFPNTKKVQSPLAPHIVNTITAALTMNPYKVQFDPTSIGPAGEQNAALRENFFNGAWVRQEKDKRRRLFRLWAHAVIGKGEGVLKTVERSKRAWSGYDKQSSDLEARLADPNDEEYGDVAKAAADGDFTERDRIFNARTEEMKRGMAYPIESMDVPPETFYYLKGEDGFALCCEVKNVPYYSTLERYNMGFDKGGKVVPQAMSLAKNEWASVMSGGKTKTLKMYELWDWREVNYVLAGPGDDADKMQGQFIKTVRHGYGIPELKTLKGPYFHCFGITTSSRENHLMGLSVLFGWLKLFPWLDELLTILGAAAYQFGYPRYRRKGGGAEEIKPSNFGRDEIDKRNKQQEIEPGDILPWDIEPVEAPSTGPDLGEAIKICRDLIEMCLPAAVQGAVQGDESGYLLAQATHLARLIWEPIVDNMQFCLAERTEFESWLIEKKIRENVYVWGMEPKPGGLTRKKPKAMWLGIGPDDIKGIHTYTIKLAPSTPSQNVIKTRTLTEQLGQRLITRDDAVLDLGKNPSEVEAFWMLYDLKQMLVPDILQQAKSRVLAKQQASANRQNEAEAAQNPMAQAAEGGANGRTGAGEVPQPGQNGQQIEPTPPDQIGGPIAGAPQLPNNTQGA